jgi:DNA-binding NarL/FixJ family response regulator
VKSPPEASAGPITVLIADDHPLVREGLAGIFKSQNDIRVVAEATNGEEALELCNRHLPVVLLDLRMPKKWTAGDGGTAGSESYQTAGYRHDDL